MACSLIVASGCTPQRTGVDVASRAAQGAARSAADFCTGGGGCSTGRFDRRVHEFDSTRVFVFGSGADCACDTAGTDRRAVRLAARKDSRGRVSICTMFSSTEEHSAEPAQALLAPAEP